MKVLRDVSIERDDVRYYLVTLNPKRYFTIEAGALIEHDWREGTRALPFLTISRGADVDFEAAFSGNVSEDALKDARQVRDRLLSILEKRG